MTQVRLTTTMHEALSGFVENFVALSGAYDPIYATLPNTIVDDRAQTHVRISISHAGIRVLATDQSRVEHMLTGVDFPGHLRDRTETLVDMIVELIWKAYPKVYSWSGSFSNDPFKVVLTDSTMVGTRRWMLDLLKHDPADKYELRLQPTNQCLVDCRRLSGLRIGFVLRSTAII